MGDTESEGSVLGVRRPVAWGAFCGPKWGRMGQDGTWREILSCLCEAWDLTLDALSMPPSPC